MTGSADIETLFRLHYRPLCLYALHYVADADVAEDMVQEAFTALLGQEVDQPKAWLYTAVRNRCIDHLRRAKAGRTVPLDAEGEISDEEAVDRSGEEARLWEAVGKLPEMRRRCLVMAKRDNMSYNEIATALGLSPLTVRNHISRALATLRSSSQDILSFVFLFF
ncbi:MAG: sigma-70 family RNA polymerase sigma factor [Bacteroidales bacterium]|nr:sigma-70 family RNA polymerase sigma factor [Bacteroidales bacterium]